MTTLICSRKGCEKEIDHTDYVRKGEHNFCSHECAVKTDGPIGNKNDPPNMGFVVDWAPSPPE